MSERELPNPSMSSDIISEDGQLLISKFLERNSLLYSDFLEVWKALSFTQLLWYMYTCIYDLGSIGVAIVNLNC